MPNKTSLDNVYLPSQDLVVRDIQGELIMIPITSDVGNLEDEIFTLNETGRAIWEKMNGKKTLKDIALELSEIFEVTVEIIERDILGITEELLKRRMLVEVNEA